MSGFAMAQPTYVFSIKNIDFSNSFMLNYTSKFRGTEGLMDEVRIRDIAREADVLSPNLDAPQAVEFTEFTLPIFWGALKE